jgi:hypothetical protein
MANADPDSGAQQQRKSGNPTGSHWLRNIGIGVVACLAILAGLRAVLDRKEPKHAVLRIEPIPRVDPSGTTDPASGIPSPTRCGAPDFASHEWFTFLSMFGGGVKTMSPDDRPGPEQAVCRQL